MYGSAAFVVGFAAVMAVLVHNAPIRVSNAETGITTETAKKEASVEETKSTQTNDAPAAVAMPTNTSTSRTPVTGTTTAQVPTVTPTNPVVTTPTPTTPVVTVPEIELPTLPPIEVPPVVVPPIEEPEPILDVNLLGIEIKV